MLVEATGTGQKRRFENGSVTKQDQVNGEKKVKGEERSTNKQGTKVKPGAWSTTRKSKQADACSVGMGKKPYTKQFMGGVKDGYD